MMLDLRRAREELGLSQREFAKLCTTFRGGSTVSQAQVCQWERTGKMSRTSRKMLEAFIDHQRRILNDDSTHAAER